MTKQNDEAIDPVVAEDNEYWRKIIYRTQDMISSTLKSRPIVFGLSGGIDSAFLALLVARSIGKERCICPFLPAGPWHMEKDGPKDRALKLTQELGMSWMEIPVGDAVDGINGKILNLAAQTNRRPEDNPKLALIKGNVAARTRMNIVYGLANYYGGLVGGTSNLTEILLGYGTKHGDCACDFLPLGCFLKTNIRKMYKVLEGPDCILKAAPSADLWEGQTDEGEIKCSYDDLDNAIMQLSRDKIPSPSTVLDPKMVNRKSCLNARIIETVMGRWEESKHKRSTTPVINPFEG